MSERKGFNYPLEPVRNLTDWNMNDLARELASFNVAVDAQQEEVKRLVDCFAVARSEVIAQRQIQALLDIAAQRRAHGYMVQVQQQLAAEKLKLEEMQKQRETMFLKLNELRKFAEGLERNKESAVEEYDQKLVKQGYEQADESWLQRLNWRKQL